MGDPKSDFIVTMHCVVRAAGSSKSSGTKAACTLAAIFSAQAFMLAAMFLAHGTA